jgi:acyl dehydratase
LEKSLSSPALGLLLGLEEHADAPIGVEPRELAALDRCLLSHRLERPTIAFVEQGACFLKPVRLGDTVYPQFGITGLGRKRGLLRLAVRVLRQDGEVVPEGHHTYLLPCR